jgi:hypothetical protein
MGGSVKGDTANLSVTFLYICNFHISYEMFLLIAADIEKPLLTSEHDISVTEFTNLFPKLCGSTIQWTNLPSLSLMLCWTFTFYTCLHITLYKMVHGMTKDEQRDEGFEVLVAVVMESCSFWDIMPRSPLKVN